MNQIKDEVDVHEVFPPIEDTIFKQDEDGDTDLHLIIAKGAPYENMALRIINSTADGFQLNLINNDHYSVLHMATLARSQEIIRNLIVKGTNPCFRNKDGNTALHLACISNDIKSAKSLMQRESPEKVSEQATASKIPTLKELEIYNNEGETCLHIAVSKNNQKLVNLLLLHGADIEAKTKLSGYTALGIAIDRKYCSLAEFLLKEWNADMCNVIDQMRNRVDHNELNICVNKFYEQDEDGDTQLHLIIANGSQYEDMAIKIIKFTTDASLLNLINNDGYSALHIATLVGSSKIILQLIKKGADPCLRNSKGNTALHMACRQNDIHSAQALMYRDLPENMSRNAGIIKHPKLKELEIYNYEGETCLHIAVSKNNKELGHALLLHGADVEAGTKTAGYTGLHMAVQQKSYDLVEFLLKKWKANVHAENWGCRTACDIAVFYHDDRMVELLVKFGAYQRLLSDSDDDISTSDDEES